MTGSRRPSQRGATVMIGTVVAAVVGALGIGGALACAVAADAATAEAAADAAAHDGEVAAESLPDVARDDLSVAVQRDPGACRLEPLSHPPADADPACRALWSAAASAVASASPRAHLVLLVAVPAAADARSGRAAGRVEILARVAVERRLPWCSGATPPEATAVRTTCWSLAWSAAHVA